jgi:hypothetical protein
LPVPRRQVLLILKRQTPRTWKLYGSFRTIVGMIGVLVPENYLQIPW